MRNKLTTGVLAGGVAVAAVVFITTLVHAVYYSPDSEIQLPASIASSTPSAPFAAKPARLEIPSLNIDAHVQFAGINAKGDMMAPNNFTDVAWYKYGPVPGQIGSAVIDGHVDNGLALAGVFKHLGDIKAGDDVYVVDQNGAKLHFVVTDVKAYPYTAAPADEIFGRTDAARLNLITCAGTWVAGQRTYNERLVVYTKLASS